MHRSRWVILARVSRLRRILYGVVHAGGYPWAAAAERPLLRWQRSRVRGSARDPTGEVGIALDGLWVHPKPAVHSSSAHHEALDMWLSGQRIALSWIDAQQQTALSARADCHVAIDQKCKAAEHRSFCQPWFVLQHLTQTVCQFSVVRHFNSMSRCTDNPAPFEMSPRCKRFVNLMRSVIRLSPVCD